MGLIQKKDEKDEIDGIQIIERGEGPDGDADEKIDRVAGASAEHIAAGTTRTPPTRTSCPKSRTMTTATWTTMHPSTRRR